MRASSGSTPKGAPSRVYRVTRVIGGRAREDFAGVEVEGEGGRLASKEEVVLPVSYLLFSGALRYKGYSVMVHERSGLEAGPSYSRTCILCHNTSPYALSLLGALAGGKAPSYQGEVVDRLLPETMRWTYAASDGEGMRRAVEAEARSLGGEAASENHGGGDDRFLRRAIAVVRDRFDPSRLVEVGIGCEACHGGAREHVEDARVRPSFLPRAPWLAVRARGLGECAVARRSDQPRLRAVPSGPLLALPVDVGGGPARRDPRREQHQLGRGARFPPRRVRARDELHGLPRSARGRRGRAPPGARDARGQRGLPRLPREPARAAALRAHAHHDPAG